MFKIVKRYEMGLVIMQIRKRVLRHGIILLLSWTSKDMSSKKMKISDILANSHA